MDKKLTRRCSTINCMNVQICIFIALDKVHFTTKNIVISNKKVLIIFLISAQKHYVVGTHTKRLNEALCMITHNIMFVCRNKNKSCRRTASSPAGYILYCNIFIIKPYNICHTDLDVFVCKSFCHLDIIIQV